MLILQMMDGLDQALRCIDPRLRLRVQLLISLGRQSLLAESLQCFQQARLIVSFLIQPGEPVAEAEGFRLCMRVGLLSDGEQAIAQSDQLVRAEVRWALGSMTRLGWIGLGRRGDDCPSRALAW